jgi:hypothetical protein
MKWPNSCINITRANTVTEPIGDVREDRLVGRDNDVDSEDVDSEAAAVVAVVAAVSATSPTDGGSTFSVVVGDLDLPLPLIEERNDEADDYVND